MPELQSLDWIIVGVYFAVILGIAWWAIKQKQDTSTKYFLASQPAYEKIQSLAYRTTVAEDKAASRTSWTRKDALLSFIILAIIVLVMICLSPLVIAR